MEPFDFSVYHDVATDNKTAAVGIVIFDQRVLMLKRNYPPLNWCPPCGRVAIQERIVDGLKREVYEESGLSVKIGPFVSHWEGVHNGEKIQSFTFICYASTDEVTLSKEHSDYYWVPISELEKWKSKTDFDITNWAAWIQRI